MKKITLITLTLLSSIGLAQTVNIPSTHVTLKMPAGFTIADNFIGIVKDESTLVQFYDLVGGNYYTNAKDFSKEEFEKLGATVFNFKDTTISSYPAKYILMQGKPKEKSFSIVLGDTTFSLMAMGIFGADDKTAERDIKDALLSIKYDKSIKTDPFAILPFTVDDSRNKFKFAKSSAGLFMYSLNGIVKESYDDEPMIIITHFPSAGYTPVGVSDLFLDGLTKYGFTDKKTLTESTIKVNGADAYERIISGTQNGNKITYYMLSIVNGKHVVSFQLVDKSIDNMYVTEAKKLAQTITFK